jgi:ABC-type branched-subunit amino acid transport system permease subunit
MVLHLRLAAAFALVGFIFTSKLWLRWLHGLGPEHGLAVKWVAILGAILLLDWADPTLKLEHKTQALGVIMVLAAFNMIFNYQSEWIDESGSGNVQVQTPDGALYRRARTILGLDPELARLFVFVLVPFILVFFGSRLIRNGTKLNLD